MAYTHHHRHHGRVFVGRVMVIIACVLAAAVNGWVARRAAAIPDPLQTVELTALISIPWIIAGAWGICMRKSWGRGLMIGLLSIGWFSYGMGSIAALVGGSDPLRARLLPLVAGTVVYALGALVLAKSRDVKRLTSRALE
jgi:tetrahydromethanopterin S-methyltransferase subunit C